MKILYIANIRLPTEKAHGAQIMKTCEAFAAAGVELELAVTNRASAIAGDPFAYYGIKTRFAIARLPVIDTVGWGKFGFIAESLSFARAARRLVRERAPDLVYGRDEFVLARLRSGTPFVWETHTGAWNRAARQTVARAHKIVAISQGLKDFYVEKGIPAEKILVAHDGIDLEAFAHPESKAAARARLGLPQDKKVALYIGRLDGWKGAGTLFEAAAFLPQGFQVAVIGGEPAQLEAYKKKYPDILFLGHRPYRELAGNQQAADVLVLPNTGLDPVSARFTSPMKLFAYMASGVPIAASDLPSIREILDESAAYFFKPDDPEALASAISTALEDSEAPARAAKALALARSYTWDARAALIFNTL